MKIIFLFIFLLFSYHLKAQETNKDSLPKIYTVAEQMPMFRDSSCLDLASYNERKLCADQKMLSFIYNNLHYPCSYSLRTGLEGLIVLSFVVEIDGSLSRFKILKNNDYALFDQEFIRVIKLSAEENGPWIPAVQDGQKVPVRLSFPCRLHFQ